MDPAAEAASLPKLFAAYDVIVSHGRPPDPKSDGAPKDEPPWEPEPVRQSESSKPPQRKPSEYHTLPTRAGQYTELTE
jgi:hypothetical protein